MKKIVLLTALAIAGFVLTSLAQTVPNNVPTNGLVGWWPFNGNAIDESSNTNDGTVNGATLTTDRFGNVSSAYSFDGISNFIDIGDPTSNSFDFFGSNFTISTWINTISNQLDGPIVNKQSLAISANESGDYNIDIVNGNGRFAMGMGNGEGAFRLSQNQINNGAWHQIVAIYNTNNIEIYIDGVLENGTYNGPPIFPSTLANSIESLRFGKGWTYHYDGKLDDIGIWNRALTPIEITGLYNANLCFQTITVTDTLLINTNLTGFNPVTYQNTIKIWPNPTNDHITIDNGNLANLTGYQLKISNVLGQQVFQATITQQQFYVDMSTWGGNGIYFVNLINAQGVTIETRKIVLQ